MYNLLLNRKQKREISSKISRRGQDYTHYCKRGTYIIKGYWQDYSQGDG